MSTLLKRLSVSINERMRPNEDAFTPKALASSTSFNDFSLHVSNDVDEHVTQNTAAGAASPGTPFAGPPLSMLSSSAPPAGMGGLSAAAALKLSPMAHLLSQRSRGIKSPESEAGTPRSSLDHAPSSGAPTPRTSLSYPRSPRGLAVVPAGDEPSSPHSPRSPTTPGGRRRKSTSHKIDGMDYYEFCELIRSSSL